MNERNSFYDINSFYNKKAKLKASFKGMRYQVEQIDDEESGKVLRVTIWPEPFSSEKTPEEYKEVYEFSYDEEGLDKIDIGKDKKNRRIINVSGPCEIPLKEESSQNSYMP